MKKNPLVKPVLKWVGGKRQLLNEILPLIDNNCTTYVEPFIGGGAVCFETQFQNVIINDYNEELINLYKVIKNNQEELISELKQDMMKIIKKNQYKTLLVIVQTMKLCLK